MAVSIDPDIQENLFMIIGCVRELHRKLWDEPLENQRSAIKRMDELSYIDNALSVLREGNYEEAKQNRTEAEWKYINE
ncbi:MAG: hypothetical protein R6U89_02440 [Dehalococcoidia bacterium]